MALRFAIHEIRSGAVVTEARTVADFADADLPSLEAAGAVREATAAEEALYRLANPTAASAVKKMRGKPVDAVVPEGASQVAGVDDPALDL